MSDQQHQPQMTPQLQEPQQQQEPQLQEPQQSQPQQPLDQQLPSNAQEAPAVAAGTTQLLPTPPPRPVEAAAATKSIGEEASAADASLRARFISRLIGFTELLNSELPAGSCMSRHRLRHYLAGSTQPSELADCLLQFEDHLGSSIRERGPETSRWRDQVFAAQSLDRLDELLDRLLTINRTLARLLRGRRGVCCSCRQPVTADTADGELAFCYSCCYNYHHQCAEPAPALAAAAHNAEASTSGVADAAAAPSKSADTLWLCAECRRPQKTPKKRKVGASNQKLEQHQSQDEQKQQQQQQDQQQQDQQPQDQQHQDQQHQDQQPQDQQQQDQQHQDQQQQDQQQQDQQQQQSQDQQQQQLSRDLEKLQPQEEKRLPQALQQKPAPTPPSLPTFSNSIVRENAQPPARERGERPTTRLGFWPRSLFSVPSGFRSGLRYSPVTGFSNSSSFGVATQQRRPAARAGSREPAIASYPNFSFPIIAQASQNNASEIPSGNEVDYDMADAAADDANSSEQAREEEVEEEEAEQDLMEE